MVKFLHTADWQLGMTRYFLEGEAQARFTQARIDVIRKIGALAAKEGCGFVLVCGDVFESNQVGRQVVVRALEAMSDTPQVKFYLLPGNHDPLDASSVYRSRTFTSSKPVNVVVIKSPNPWEVEPGVEVVPAPWLSKRPLIDLVDNACQGLSPPERLRIVVGHGALDTWPQSRNPTLIGVSKLEDRLASGLIHFVALGDRHSTTKVGDTGRIWYSGAPEPTGFDEVDPGKALVVTLHADREPMVEERSVGTWRFLYKEWDLTGKADLDALDDWLSGSRGKERTIVRLKLKGQISLGQKAQLDQISEDHSAPFADLDIGDGDDLLVLPDDFDLDDLGLSGYALEVFGDIRELAQAGEHVVAAGDALALLYRLARESR